MTSILLAASMLAGVGIVAGVGLIAGLGLAIAASVMHVKTDPRVEEVTAALPGVNCGACGYPGCMSYAEAIVNEGVAGNRCTPGGNGAAQAIAVIMGIQAEVVADRKALVRCGGTHELCKPSYEYRGEQTCAAASLLYSGQKQCNYGCLGFGDCARVCPYHAISIINGIAVVNQDICVGCALCVSSCFKGIIGMTETKGKAINRCCSEAPGAVVRRQCATGCIGCKLCERNCPQGAITVTNGLAHVDAARCNGCGLCHDKCPTHCLVMSPLKGSAGCVTATIA